MALCQPMCALALFFDWIQLTSAEPAAKRPVFTPIILHSRRVVCSLRAFLNFYFRNAHLKWPIS